MPYPVTSGTPSGFSSLSSGWTVGIVNNLYTIAYNGTPVQQSSTTGTTLASSVTTGVGSFHLGQSHSLGAAGQNVTFKNGHTNVCWFPVWQGQSTDGTSVINPTARIFAQSQTVNEFNGAINLAGTAIPYTVTDTITQTLAGTGNSGMSFTQAIMYPAETYAGNINWIASFQSDSIQIANVTVTGGCTTGVALTINFDYPLDVRVGDVITITMTKADGTTLSSYPGVTTAGQPYRKLTYRTFVDGSVAAAGNYTDSKSTLVTTIQDQTNLNQTSVFLSSTLSGTGAPYYLLKAGSGAANTTAKDSIRAYHNDNQSSLEYNQAGFNWARVVCGYDTTRFFAVNVDNTETHRTTPTTLKWTLNTGTGGASRTRIAFDGSGMALWAPNDTTTSIYLNDTFFNTQIANHNRLSLDTGSSWLQSPTSISYYRTSDTDAVINVNSAQRMQINGTTTTLWSPTSGNGQLVLTDSITQLIGQSGFGCFQYTGGTTTVSGGTVGAGNFSYVNITSTAFTSNRAWGGPSDATLKTPLTDFPDSLLDSWLKNVKYGSFRWLSEGDSGKIQSGLIAQDIVKAFDEAGLNYEDYGVVYKIEDGTFAVAYSHVQCIESAAIRRKLGL